MNNKIIIGLLIIIFIIINNNNNINNVVANKINIIDKSYYYNHDYNINNNNDIITLIVNCNNFNNNYKIGSKCGNSTEFTCNSIQDAISYFNEIANIKNDNNNNLIMYQPLSIKLMDGNYGILENSISFEKYNITISPFHNQDGSNNNVEFDGTINTSNNPLFYIVSNSSIPKPSPSPMPNSILTISNINFKNFIKPILKTNSTKSNIEITISNCNIYNFTSSKSELNRFGEPLIQLIGNNNLNNNSMINYYNDLKLNLINLNFNSFLNIYKTLFKTKLIHLEYLNQLNIDNCNFENIKKNQGYIYSLLYTLGCKSIELSNNNFNDIEIGNGLLYIENSLLNLQSNNNFNNIYSKNYGTIITFKKSNNLNYLNINNCVFNNCKSEYSSGVIYIFGQDTTTSSSSSITTINATTCTITNSKFKNNSGTTSNVLTSQNIDFIKIDNCNFINDNHQDNDGDDERSLFNFMGSFNVLILNSIIIDDTSSSIKVLDNSNLTAIDNTFSKNNKMFIDCENISKINFENNLNLNTNNLSCKNDCLEIIINKINYC